jgi:hypothetical protein
VRSPHHHAVDDDPDAEDALDEAFPVARTRIASGQSSVA